MSGSSLVVNSYDEARDDLLQTLRTYRAERKNIAREKELIAEAVEGLYSPTGKTCDSEVRAKGATGDDAMVNRLTRIEGERARLDRALRQILDRERKLNIVLAAVSLLPAFERRVIVGLYIDGKPREDICTEIGKSDETVDRHRKNALRKATRSLYHVRVGASMTENTGPGNP